MGKTFYSIDSLNNYRLYEIVTEDKEDFIYKIYNKDYGRKPLKVYTSKEDLHMLSVNDILGSEAYDVFVSFVEDREKEETLSNMESPSLDKWYEKDLFGNIVRKTNTNNRKVFNYYNNDSYFPKKKEKIDSEKVKELNKSDTLVFHLTDPSTVMLGQIYKGKGYDEVHSKLNTPTVKALIDSHDKIICLGHGSGYGLIGMFGPEVKENFKGKNLFIIWCNADKYFSDPCFDGNFITGNMPSEVWECKAAGCGDISSKLMLENITYWSKLCADSLPTCLNGNVASAVNYIRTEYIKKYGDHPVTHYNSVRTMVHGDSYEKAENEVKLIEDKLYIHPNWEKYNSNSSNTSSEINLRSFNNKQLNNSLDKILNLISRNFEKGKFSLESVCNGEEYFLNSLAESLISDLKTKYPDYEFIYSKEDKTITWLKKDLTESTENNLKEYSKFVKIYTSDEEYK